MWRWLFILACTITVYKFWPSSHSTPTQVTAFASDIQVRNDPIQKEVTGIPAFQKNGYLIQPVASFQVDGLVLSSHFYEPRSDLEADLAPIDLALGWGPMSDPTLISKIQVTQSNRFYHWHVTEYPIPREEIETHSANMHMIPANEEVEAQLKDIRNGQSVRISGYLVNVRGEGGYQWHSSLTRKDTGFGACEVIWVQSVATLSN